MTEQIWFTGDTHFDHQRMADQWRPFNSVEEMNEKLIEAWNSKIKKGDRVYHLGDFSFGNKTKIEETLDRLNGQIHMIRGNHDGQLDSLAHRFASYSPYRELKIPGYAGHRRVILFHFPIESWHGVGRGQFHLHGHTHNNLATIPNARRKDVGVDTRDDWGPYSWEEIQAELEGIQDYWTPSDHHQYKHEGEKE